MGPDVVGEPVDHHRLLFSAQRVGDLIELRHCAGLELPFASGKENLALKSDDHSSVVVLHRGDLRDGVACVLELGLEVDKLLSLLIGGLLLRLELILGLVERLLGLIELAAGGLELCRHHALEVALGRCNVLLRLQYGRLGLGDLGLSLGDDREIKRVRLVWRVAPGPLRFLQGEVGFVDVGRVKLNGNSVLGGCHLVARVDQRLRGGAVAAARAEPSHNQRRHHDGKTSKVHSLLQILSVPFGFLQVLLGLLSLALCLRCPCEAERELRFDTSESDQARRTLVVLIVHESLGLLQVLLRELKVQFRVGHCRRTPALGPPDIRLSGRPLVIRRRNATAAGSS